MLNLTDEELSQAHKEGWTLAYGGTHLRCLYNEVGNPIIPTLIEGYMMILRKAEDGSELHRKVIFGLPWTSFENENKKHFAVLRDKHTALQIEEKLLGNRKN